MENGKTHYNDLVIADLVCGVMDIEIVCIALLCSCFMFVGTLSFRPMQYVSLCLQNVVHAL